MTVREFEIFADALKTYYPREKIMPNEQALTLWYKQLQDIDAKVAGAVLQKWVATNKWSPSIADIREQASKLTVGTPKDWGEAWESARYAVRRWGRNREQEALESLDDLTRQVVNRIGFQTLCNSEEIGVERANFRMIYEQLASRTKETNQLPPKIKALVENTAKRLAEPNEPKELCAEPKELGESNLKPPSNPPTSSTDELIKSTMEKLGGRL